VHAPRVVAVARHLAGRGGRLDGRDLARGEFEADAVERLGQPVSSLGADEGDDVVAAERPQAIASCAAVTPRSAATASSASSRASFLGRFPAVTISAIAPTVSSMGTSGSSLAGCYKSM